VHPFSAARTHADLSFSHLDQHIGTSEEPIPQTHIPLSGFAGEDHASPTQVLDEAAVEEVDDDYWDVDSDEEMAEADGHDEDTQILRRDFSLIRRIHFENSSELAIRRYDAFIFEGILSQYKPEQVANPLKNPKTARVFAHFIHVTAPVSVLFSTPILCTHATSSQCRYTIEIRETLRPSSKGPPHILNRISGHISCP
jgi:hypothetical protein